MTSKKSIYQLHLSLSDISPPIWRRVEVLGDITLYRLAATLLVVMGWSGGHMHQFRVGKKLYSLPDEDFADEFQIIDERDVTLREIMQEGTKEFVFEYDFGDGWEHVIKLEKVIEPVKEEVVSTGSRADPFSSSGCCTQY
jgi:hypothetical protein